MSDFVTSLIRSKLAPRHAIIGCPTSEIREIEQAFGLPLPKSYVEFLRDAGKNAGLFMRGTDMFYPALLKNRAALQDVLDRDGNPFLLSGGTFVFSNHQGYIFHFFDTCVGMDDPPVFGYKEGELSTRKIDESFSMFLMSAVDEQREGWSIIR